METDPEIMCGIVGNIGQFWLKEQFIDLQINIDDNQFRCHRFILCACSEFFQVLLQSEVKDEVEHPVKEVTVRGISPDVFQLVLNAIYKGENGLHTENMMEFWHAAHELQIPVLIAKCEAFISSHMTQENFLGIYTMALLLKSEKIVKMVHEFMAENFEYLSKCQLFMLLSAKTLHKIFSSKLLKVDTQNDLVDLILKWVSHEPCGIEVKKSYAGDILEVQDTNIVSDQRLNHSTSGINNRKGSVEVILQKPPVTSENSCLQIVAQLLTETPAARKASLGKLFKLVRLSETSRDCLEILADSDAIMGVKETRDIVRQALEAHSHAQETMNTTALTANSVVASVMFEYTEQVVIFGKGDTIYAYSLDRSGVFHFMSCCDLLRIYTFNNSIFITETINSEVQMTVYNFANSEKNKTVFNNVQSCSAIVGDFLYIFDDNSLCRKRSDDQSSDWFQLIDFKRKINCVLVNIFKDSIIFYDLEAHQETLYGNEGTMFCFNTKTHRVWGIKIFSEVHKVVSFIHDDQLYVLTHNGYLWNITAEGDPPTTNSRDAVTQSLWNEDHYANNYKMKGKSVKQKLHSGTSNPQRLWESSHELLGAVIHTGKLVIFANLNYCKAPVITNQNIILGLSEIHFIHLHSANKCYPLVVPSTMLVKEY